MQSKIDTIARRKKLPVASHPVWDAIGDAGRGLKLGYRKGARGGVWVGKLVMDGARVETTLGRGGRRRRNGHELRRRDSSGDCLGRERACAPDSERRDDESDRVATVADAIEAYVKMRIARAERAGRDAQTRLARHVLSDAKLASHAGRARDGEDLERLALAPARDDDARRNRTGS